MDKENTKVKVKKADKNAEPKEQDGKFLAWVEMQQIESGHADSNYGALMVKYHQLELEKAKKELTLHSANYTLKQKEIEELNQKIKTAVDKHTARLISHKEYMDSLKEKYKISKKQWGYDPTTGEIEPNDTNFN